MHTFILLRGKGISFDESSTSAGHNWRRHGSFKQLIGKEKNEDKSYLYDGVSGLYWISTGETHLLAK